VALSVLLFASAAYAIEHQLIGWLLRPAHNQSFIYTSPLDGINFIFKVCIYVGVGLSSPVIIYQLLRYLEPLLKHSSARFIYWGTAVSGLLAIAGMSFGYFVGLPAALDFLLHQFHTAQIKPLLTVDEYMSFVTVYMVGAALMFQIPLIVLFIDRVHRLKPRQLWHYERWVVLGSVVLAAVMNPSPNVIAILFIALPILLTYQLSIGIVWWLQNNGRRQKLLRLVEADAAVQAARFERVEQGIAQGRQLENLK
jgi:sec-independent protein translocase protein TatC